VAATADPDSGAFFGRSAHGLPAFLHVVPFGLGHRLRTSAVGTKATCLDNVGKRSTERIGAGLGSGYILVRYGRFSAIRTRDEDPSTDRRLVTQKIRGSFSSPSRATGVAQVIVSVSNASGFSERCDSGPVSFTVFLRR
jgi:hypothetical protein